MNTKPLKPENGSVKTAEDTKNVAVDFEWAPVEQVKEYTVKCGVKHARTRPDVHHIENE